MNWYQMKEHQARKQSGGAAPVLPTWGEVLLDKGCQHHAKHISRNPRRAVPQSARYPGCPSFPPRGYSTTCWKPPPYRRPSLPTRCNPLRWASPAHPTLPLVAPSFQWLGATKSGTDHPVNNPFFPCHSGKPETCIATKHPFQERRYPPRYGLLGQD